MAFTWGEISKWAKDHGFKVSKKNDLFLWHNLENPDVCGEEKSLDQMITAVFNEISGHKWVDHQKWYKSNIK
jgi:hypothetical protein